MTPQDRAPVGLLSVLHHYMRLFFHFKTSDEKVKNFIDIITSFVFLKSYLLAQVLVCVRVRAHQTLRGPARLSNTLKSRLQAVCELPCVGAGKLCPLEKKHDHRPSLQTSVLK